MEPACISFQPVDLIGPSPGPPFSSLSSLQLRSPRILPTPIMAQITFRINTKPTYSERMTESRSELRKIIKDQLCKCHFRHHSIPSRRAALPASRRDAPHPCVRGRLLCFVFLSHYFCFCCAGHRGRANTYPLNTYRSNHERQECSDGLEPQVIHEKRRPTLSCPY